jgi:predicted MarR family transcription regulator
VAALLGRDLASYSRGAMTYDLRRLRLHGLIQRRPGTHRYTVTTDGLRVALFYTKVYLRILRPAAAALAAPADDLPHPLRDALRHLDLAIDQLCAEAQLQEVA